ncbi:DUF2062 domain-containing protein [Salinadaptatus halalkaliphilus]|uniref:DUF2062 domain-containing protein n=1 Tax=Salinadaptatus halalkaliphilus TaxID=2419781 RepID=A0A4V3VLR3_9EURY|nr:DUF2062 domain-containing protein [Salinadaptatus halalkaliphilus]THE66677.1 DUF2062 domain-containing protein [Salinadaptatus halalkaliphilus]
MGRGRIGRYTERVRGELHDAFREDFTPRELSGSFAIGAFITMLPTFGIGLVAFVAIGYVFGWVSKLALFASVLVFNPAVKWGVYAASFALGTILLGPVEGVSAAGVSFSAGPDIVVRLLVGNLILAVLATILSYVVVYRFARRYQSTAVAETIDETLEEIAETTLDSDSESG